MRGVDGLVRLGRKLNSADGQRARRIVGRRRRMKMFVAMTSTVAAGRVAAAAAVAIWKKEVRASSLLRSVKRYVRGTQRPGSTLMKFIVVGGLEIALYYARGRYVGLSEKMWTLASPSKT